MDRRERRRRRRQGEWCYTSKQREAMEKFVGTLRKLELADYDDNLNLVKKNDKHRVKSYRTIWGEATWRGPDKWGETIDPDGCQTVDGYASVPK